MARSNIDFSRETESAGSSTGNKYTKKGKRKYVAELSKICTNEQEIQRPGTIKRTNSYFAFAFAPSVHPHTSTTMGGDTIKPSVPTSTQVKELTIEEKKLLYRKSWLLTISSSFFLFPAVFAYHHAIYSMSFLSIFTTIVSIAFWYRPRDGIRRFLDLVVAKVSFVIYFTVGLVNIRDTSVFIGGLIGAVLMIGSYSTGLKLFDMRSARWVYAHMLFHFFVACGQVLVLYGSFLL